MMDRKKTILVAVLINAGLLVVLFIAALTTEEEVAPQLALQESTPQPFFTESLDLGVKPPPLPESTIASVPVEIPALVSLPPLASETETPPPMTPPVTLHTAPLHSGYTELTVKKGDSLEKIAKAQHTSVDELIKLNHLPSTFLRVGQVLKIPHSKPHSNVVKVKSSPESAATSAEFYTVKVGDNPWTIAMKHHMKVDELLKLNGLNEEKARKLKAGDRLRIR